MCCSVLFYSIGTKHLLPVLEREMKFSTPLWEKTLAVRCLAFHEVQRKHFQKYQEKTSRIQL